MQLRTVGLLGGMSWESTAVYYSTINRAVRSKCSGLTSAPLLLHSFDFAHIAALQTQNKWDDLARLLSDAALQLQSAGAAGIAICTNTMHKVAESVVARLTVPLIDIRGVTGTALINTQCKRVGLLGTLYTMQDGFFRDYLCEQYALEVVTPSLHSQQTIHTIIFDELCQGAVIGSSRMAALSIIEELVLQGAQAVVLGCTELMLLLNDDCCAIPLFDTTTIHAESIAEFAMGSKIIACDRDEPTTKHARHRLGNTAYAANGHEEIYLE